MRYVLLFCTCKVREEDQLSRIPALKTWFRTSRAVVMHLSNGTLQINFFKDHTKIILCPLLGAVTYIDETRKNRTFRYGHFYFFMINFILIIVDLTSSRSTGVVRSLLHVLTTHTIRLRQCWTPRGVLEEPCLLNLLDNSTYRYWRIDTCSSFTSGYSLMYLV